MRQGFARLGGSSMRAVVTVPEFPLDGSVKTLGWQAAAWVEESPRVQIQQVMV